MQLIDSFYLKLRRFLWINFPKIMRLLHRRKSLVKFFMSGVVTTILDLILLFLFYDVLNFSIIKSTSISFTLCFLLSFFMQKIWTFRNRGSKKVVRQMIMYFAVGFLNLNLNGVMMHTLVVGFSVWYILAQVMVNLMLGGGNYFCSKFIIFRKTNEI